MLIILTASSSVLTKTKLSLGLINAIFRVVMKDSNFPKHCKLYVIDARSTKDIYHIMKQYLHNLARKKLPKYSLAECSV